MGHGRPEQRREVDAQRRAAAWSLAGHCANGETRSDGRIQRSHAMLCHVCYVMCAMYVYMLCYGGRDLATPATSRQGLNQTKPDKTKQNQPSTSRPAVAAR